MNKVKILGDLLDAGLSFYLTKIDYELILISCAFRDDLPSFYC